MLTDLRDETAALGPVATMQIGPDQGQLLTLFARLVGARRAVEVGTFTGYSSLCIARGLAAGGTLLCCDVSEEWTALARRAWGACRAGRAHRAAHRPGARDVAVAAAGADDRPRLHRRRQGRLLGLLGPARFPVRIRGRAAGRQCPVVRPCGRRRRRRRHPCIREFNDRVADDRPTWSFSRRSTASPSASALTVRRPNDVGPGVSGPSPLGGLPLGGSPREFRQRSVDVHTRRSPAQRPRSRCAGLRVPPAEVRQRHVAVAVAAGLGHGELEQHVAVGGLEACRRGGPTAAGSSTALARPRTKNSPPVPSPSGTPLCRANTRRSRRSRTWAMSAP